MPEPVTVASGSALLHQAVHFKDPGDFPLEDAFFRVPEIAILFASEGIPRPTAEAWRRDPVSHLQRFLDELVAREETTPSRTGDSPKRELSDRETAIIVARFLTEPGVSTDGNDYPTLAARRERALELPAGTPPGYRRFDQDRAGGRLWQQFVSELRAHLLRSRAENRQVLPLLPAATRTVLGYAQRYADDLGRQLRGTLSENVDPADLYIERDIEAALFEDIRDGDITVLGLSGEAGTGKSSVLWSLRRKLTEAGLTPLLLSATWMASAAPDRLLRVSEVVEHALQIRNTGLTPVVLLDTADLLLHTEGLIYQTTDLVTQAEELGIRMLLTVRPVEREQLARHVKYRTLGTYADEELRDAVRVLMRRYFPKLPVETGLDLVHRAETRGLPISTVLRSPLLLRMLFDTSGGQFPGLDYDATALYERYWATRIVRDERGGRASSHLDLGPTAGRLGILMLADASPVLREERVSTTLATVAYPAPLGEMTRGMDELARRGVVFADNGTWRFAHQALFEFIAARALVTRNPDASVSLLLAHVQAHPHDLFTGAVLEQLIILLARDTATRARARDVVHALMSEVHPSLRQFGMIGWCHVPELDTPGSDVIDAAIASRMLAHLPQVQAIDAGQAISLLTTIWRSHRDIAHRALVDCLAVLVHRWPTKIAEFVVQERIIPTLLESYLASYNQSSSLVALALGVASSHPAAARDVLPELVTGLPEVAGPLRTLAGIAANWDQLHGSEEFAEAVIHAAARAERRFRSHHRDFGVAAGNVLYAELTLHRPGKPRMDADAWEAYAVEVFTGAGSTTPTIAEAARLHAVARHLLAQPSDARDHVGRVLRSLFDREPVDGPLHVVGPFLVAVMNGDGVARQMAADALFVKLDEGLPASANSDGSPQQRWALTARAALLDEETPERFVADVVDGLRPAEPALFRDPALLLPALFPAALGGDARAIAQIEAVTKDPTVLQDPADPRTTAITEFVERGSRYAARSVMVAEAVVRVIIAARRPGSLAALAATDAGAEAIRRHLVGVHALIDTLLLGANAGQQSAATCWERLQRYGLSSPTVRDVAGAIGSVTDPIAKASLIDMLPAAVSGDAATASPALALLRREVLDDFSRTGAAGLSEVRKRLVDAAFDAYRSILAATATPAAWEEVWSLVITPSLRGSGRIDTDRFPDLVTFAQSLLSASPDHASVATEDLITAATWAQAHLSRTQAKGVANLFGGTVSTIMKAGGEPAERWLEVCADLPPRLGKTVVRAAIDRGARSAVERLLARASLPAEVAADAAAYLRGNREAGFQPIPELIAGSTP